jgi:hypothetical protein
MPVPDLLLFPERHTRRPGYCRHSTSIPYSIGRFSSERMPGMFLVVKDRANIC